MNAKTKKPPQLELPDLPNLGDMELPDLPDLDSMGGLPDLNELLNPTPDILDARNGERYGDSIEENTKLDDEVIADEFQAIRDGRKKQGEAIELANDTEYWFALYFQTREQKEEFLTAMKWIALGDKYVEGRAAAKKLGIALTPRPAPFKVGKIDQKLKDLT